MLNIVLHEPEIPQNTGNIARTCAATGAKLHLIKPLGFDISEKQVRRSGLDYWHLVDIHTYDNYEEFAQKNQGGEFFFCSTKAKTVHSDMDLSGENVFLIFGKETKGLPEKLISENIDTAIRIPMISDARSLNLANSVAIVAYEALRQQGYNGLKTKGELTNHS